MLIEERLKQRLQPYVISAAKLGLDSAMFEECFLSTAGSALRYDENGKLFIVTGDIPAMWLRDSSAQVLHYLRFADEPEVKSLFLDLIKAQTECILADAYANAFNSCENGNHCLSHRDSPKPGPRVWERKYELDSLCWPCYLAQQYYKKTKDLSFADANYIAALKRIAGLFETETHHESSPYYFIREGRRDTLENNGYGKPAAYTGMIYSAFRPSDDKCEYGYPVYSNLFAAHILSFMEELLSLKGEASFAEKCRTLKAGIEEGVRRYGITEDDKYGPIFAYEVDGFGGRVMMDDANMPSLMSLPYFGILKNTDPVYKNTRAFLLSDKNPFFFSGRFAKGIGSPHTPNGYVWPIALCVQLMTSTDKNECADLLNQLESTHAGTRRMHESFDPNDPSSFTRPWFTWADSMYAEAVCRIIENGFPEGE